MDKLPTDIMICKLEVIVMPNGEVMSAGKVLGWFRDLKQYLSKKED